jgi:hypothetical protein
VLDLSLSLSFSLSFLHLSNGQSGRALLASTPRSAVAAAPAVLYYLPVTSSRACSVVAPSAVLVHMVVEWSGGTASGNGVSNAEHQQHLHEPHPRYLSASLCCIWEQPAVHAPPPPPPPRTTVAVLRPPESRRPRCLADRASWAGFSSSVLARGRSNVLMGTQILHQQQPGNT